VRSHESPFTIGVFFADFVDNAGPLLYASELDFVDFAASGSNVFNPVTTGVEAHAWGTGAGADINIPSYVDFIGRTSGGRRVRYALFGLGINSDDYRFIAGESADVDNAIDALVSAGTSLRGIDDNTPVWKRYANAGINAYWQRAVRP
jgi:hypothetical protein